MTVIRGREKKVKEGMEGRKDNGVRPWVV